MWSADSVFKSEDSAPASFSLVFLYASVLQSYVDFLLPGVPMLLAASSALMPAILLREVRGVFSSSLVVMATSVPLVHL